MKKLFLLFPVLLLSQAGMAQNNAGVVSISAPASVAPGANFSATIKVGTPQFTAGDLVVMQVGDGVRAIINTGTPMFLNNQCRTRGITRAASCGHSEFQRGLYF